MDAMLSRLGQIAAKGGALAMLSALAAYAVSREAIALLAFPAAVSVMQLLCLIEGPWTRPLMQRLAVPDRTERRR